jgi:hypothetical protein
MWLMASITVGVAVMPFPPFVQEEKKILPKSA